MIGFLESLSISGREVQWRTTHYDWRRTVIFSEFVGYLHNGFLGISSGVVKEIDSIFRRQIVL